MAQKQNEENLPPDYKAPLGKVATPLQARFADWLMGDEVGYSPATAKTKEEAFREGVRLGVALRIPYQASEANRAATAEEREARAVQRAADDAAKAENAKNKAAQRAAATPEPEPEPAKPVKRGAKKAQPATTTPPPASTRAPARRAPARRAPAANAAQSAPF